MSAVDLAVEAGAVVAVGGGITAVGGWMLKAWLRQQLDIIKRDQGTMRDAQVTIRERTAQLEHNGGSHVADYARDARDESRLTNEKLDKFGEQFTAHLIEAAELRGAMNAKIEMLQAQR